MLKKIFFLLSIFILLLAAKEPEVVITKVKLYSYLDIGNEWLQIYKNVKSYERSIKLISEYENKLSEAQKKHNTKSIDSLNRKLDIQKSKLLLYQKNNNLMKLIQPFSNITLPTITLMDYIFKESLIELDKKITKYNILINEYYLAKAHLNKIYELKLKDSDKPLLANVSVEDLNADIEYFKDFEDIIERNKQNLYDIKSDLNKSYQNYYNDVLTQHLITLFIIFGVYALNILLSMVVTRFIKEDEDKLSYRKLSTITAGVIIIITLSIRYTDNILYAFTMLSMIGAALTIVTKEIILNIAGWIYIFSTNIVKQGHRVLFLFETKHSLGDIESITLMKMTLKEVNDYNSLKEIKNSGRTLQIPNSYIFTKVFFNYSTNNKGIISDLIEIDFDLDNDFTLIEQTTAEVFKNENIKHKFSIQLNQLKTAINAQIWYETHYKKASQNKGNLTLKLLEAYKKEPAIKLKKSASKATKAKEEDE